MAELTFRCPASSCIGWVSEVEDDDETTFWGCGECGTVWDDREDLNQSISEAIEKHPYRKKCYRKTRSGWNPVPLEKEPEDYEELVEQEWDEDEQDTDDADEFEQEYPPDGDDSCYRCPVPQCSGFVRWLEEADFDGNPGWSCGYCGSIWLETKNLVKEIDAIIEKYPYRKACYTGRKGARKPAPIKKHPLGYDDVVEEEPEEKDSPSLVRG